MSTPIYKGYNFTISPLQPATEILIAELGAVGFESFVETETGVNAYIQEKDWNPTILEDIYVLGSDEFSISYVQEEIEQVNWNEEWEKNFEPILVDEKCSVRAPFHEKKEVEFDIVIEPKMSFGTGHHETTHMMIQHLLTLDIKGKKALDMGCGTGVLAILAEMRGAQPIDAIDIDNWCYLNTLENVERNNCTYITTYEGDVSLLEGKNYELIIANINRNILLNDMSSYAKSLTKGGDLLLSGFYEEDFEKINTASASFGLVFDKKIIRNNWVAAHFKKK
ncbi:50S ribosomal protein L11 methyltransferase [Aquimarina agarilytica]|uniref:50S ribosomal protein L11 methyltransferase n=1 Tax=Aquimarina agarilytica TaxID=1087449 RepID=UPI000289464E|nr:50S ribosomal protein L11 methyltransferase [Aquimarina agarilytica]